MIDDHFLSFDEVENDFPRFLNLLSSSRKYQKMFPKRKWRGENKRESSVGYFSIARTTVFLFEEDEILQSQPKKLTRKNKKVKRTTHVDIWSHRGDWALTRQLKIASLFIIVPPEFLFDSFVAERER